MKHFKSLLLLPVLYFTPVNADYTDDANTAIMTMQDKWYNTGLW
jgi:hypothetical protein